VEDIWHQLPMGYTKTSQLICHYLPRFATVAPHQSPEEPLRRCSIPPGLQEHINHLAVLVHGSPQVVLFAVDFHEDFVDEEGIAVAAVLPLQSARINGSEFDAPEADRFSADNYPRSASRSSMNGPARRARGSSDDCYHAPEIESMVEPDGVTDNVRWESVSFISIHVPILSITAT